MYVVCVVVVMKNIAELLFEQPPKTAGRERFLSTLLKSPNWVVPMSCVQSGISMIGVESKGNTTTPKQKKAA